jgi:hypothetical protein
LLPPKTEAVWAVLKDQPALAGFVLIGGSALALRLQHRVSEDLDLVFPAERLPRGALEVLQRGAAARGVILERRDDEASLHEFADGGLDLHDYQQDFLANAAVKVSFFAADAPLRKLLVAPAGAGVRIGTLTEVFQSKCLVSAVRSKTRDWLDLFLLLRDHGFTIDDYVAAFRQAGVESQSDVGLSRLCSGRPQHDDEGYHHLLENAPTLDQITEFFRRLRDQYEVMAAARRKTSP